MYSKFGSINELSNSLHVITYVITYYYFKSIFFHYLQICINQWFFIFMFSLQNYILLKIKFALFWTWHQKFTFIVTDHNVLLLVHKMFLMNLRTIPQRKKLLKRLIRLYANLGNYFKLWIPCRWQIQETEKQLFTVSEYTLKATESIWLHLISFISWNIHNLRLHTIRWFW